MPTNNNQHDNKNIESPKPKPKERKIVDLGKFEEKEKRNWKNGNEKRNSPRVVGVLSKDGKVILVCCI